jgi:PAS domain S-box-containing protein
MEAWSQDAPTELAPDFELLAESLPQLVWIQRRDGTLEFVNQRGLTYAGLTPHELCAHRIGTRLLHPEDRRRAWHSWREALRTTQPFRLEARLRGRDSSYRWHLIEGHPLRTAHGPIIRWLGTATDVHAVKESNERSAFLLALSTELARISEPHDLVCTAMLRLRERLHAARATLAEFDYQEHEAILLSQCAGEVPRIEISTLPLEFYRVLALQSPQGLTSVVHDTHVDARSAGAFESRYLPHDVAAIISVPLLRGGAAVALLSIVDSEPRRG